MTAHRTAGQLRALRELCALARTGLDVADVIAARGGESDDRPRLWLTSLERWSRGKETPAQLAAATRAMKAWRDGVHGPGRESTGPIAAWSMAAHYLADAREDMAKHPTHTTPHAARVCQHFAATLRLATGDGADAAKANVAAMLDRHRKAVGEECARAEADARLRQAKADKVTAERALGTLPGME